MAHLKYCKLRSSENPQPKPNEIRIKVHYAGINFAEIMARMKLYPGGPKPGAVLGGEVSGVVDKIGKTLKILRLVKTLLVYQ